MAAITSITIKINGKCSLKCVGKNPRLAEAKSKNDKNISGLMNSVEATKMTTYSYINSMPYSIGEEKVQIVNIEFATQEETDCEFKSAILMNVTADPQTRAVTSEGTGTAHLPEIDDEQSGDVIIPEQELEATVSVPSSWEEDGQALITVTYVKDGVEIAEFHPQETWHSGMHVLNLYYPLLDMAEKMLHTFEVWISVGSGSAAIAAQNILAVISGQGLGAQDRWDGRITASDDMTMILLSGMQHLALEGSVETRLITPTPAGSSDAISKVLLSGMPLYTLTDNLRIFAPVVHDVVDVSDKRKMSYSRVYVMDDADFRLRQSFEISGGTERSLDRGRMDSLTISTSDFVSLTGLVILPFETEPFIGGFNLPAKKLLKTAYTELDDDCVKPKTEYDETIEGELQEIERGSLAAYHLGLGAFESISELEVQNG